MNICVVNLRENNPYIGGVENVSYRLGQEWMKQNHQVIFLSLTKSPISKTYSPVCQEFFLPNADIACAKENIDFFLRLLHQFDVDIILNQGSVFPDLCSLCNTVRTQTSIPLVTSIHYAPFCKLSAVRNNFFMRARLGHNIKLWLQDLVLYLQYIVYKRKRLYKREASELRLAVEHSDKIVCLSKFFIPDFEQIIGKEKANRMMSIPNPLRQEEETEFLPRKKKQILYVGRLELGMKRVDRLIRIWAKTEKLFPDWHFYVVGDGGVLPLLRQMAYNLHLERIHFVGFQDPMSYYRESSILCLSSSTEGFGMVLVEALKQKCIPIAYDSFASLSDIVVDGENGCVVPPFNEQIYLNKLHTLMRNERLRERMMANNALTLGRFEVTTVANQWISLFNQTINK